MKKTTRFQTLLLLLTLLVVWGGGALLYFDSSKVQPHPLRETMLDAYDRMDACMAAIRAEKLARGLSIDEKDDPFLTGMVGVSSSDITTTVGALEAKRTSANPDMAALCVRLLDEAGITAGDRVACCFSGSFPCLNLAVLCAIDAVGATPVYIASIGASTYGANQPELTNPEMLLLCYEQGLLSTPPAAVTMGGQDDLGKNMLAYAFEEPELLEPVLQRLESKGLRISSYEEYSENIAWRMSLYGDVDAFVNAGGNIAATGKDQVGYHLGQGVLNARLDPESLTEKSGLISHYLAQGLPTLQLLNVKALCADYSLPYDPAVLSPRGESGVFYINHYPHWAIALIWGLAAALLLCTYGVRVWEKRSACKSKTGRS